MDGWWWDQREGGRKESSERQFVGLEMQGMALGLGRMDVESVPREVRGLCVHSSLRSFYHFLLHTGALVPVFCKEVGTGDVNLLVSEAFTSNLGVDVTRWSPGGYGEHRL